MVGGGIFAWGELYWYWVTGGGWSKSGVKFYEIIWFKPAKSTSGSSGFKSKFIGAPSYTYYYSIYLSLMKLITQLSCSGIFVLYLLANPSNEA